MNNGFRIKNKKGERFMIVDKFTETFDDMSAWRVWVVVNMQTMAITKISDNKFKDYEYVGFK